MRTILAALLALPLLMASCPTTASCPDHNVSGNPTGEYKWNGSTQYAQFSHTNPNHKWWEKCD